jgi:hypothetical protein
MALEARRFEPADAEDLAAFHVENGGSPAPPEFYLWKFQDTPTVIVRDAGRLVGRWCFMSSPLTLRGEGIKAAMTVDLDVHPEYRGTRVFPMLRRLSRKLLLEEDYALQFGVTHWRVVELGLHIGFGLAGPVRKLVHIIDPARYVPGLRGGPIGRFLEGRHAARATMDSDEPFERGGFRRVSSFDAGFDRLLAQPPPVPIYPRKDLEWLNRRYFHCPVAEYRVFASYDGDDVQSFCVLQDFWRDGVRYGLISDLAWDREQPALLPPLMRAAVAHFSRRGARSVACWDNRMPPMWPRLLWRRFLPRKTALYLNMELLREDLDPDLFLDRDQWSLAIGDTDHYLAPRVTLPASTMEASGA